MILLLALLAAPSCVIAADGGLGSAVAAALLGLALATAYGVGWLTGRRSQPIEDELDIE